MSTDRIVSLIPIPKGTSDYIQIFNSFLVFCLKMLPIVLIFSGVFGYLFYKKEKDQPIYYTARLSFVESNVINGGNMPSGADFGLGRAPRSGGNSTLDGIIKSDVILSKALFKPVSLENNEMLINYYLKKSDSAQYNTLKFQYPSLDSLSFEQTKIYNRLKSQIVGPTDGIFTFSSEDLPRMIVRSTDEQISYSLINNIFDSISEFYEQNSDNTYNESFKTLVHSRDSVYLELKRYQNQLANFDERDGFRNSPYQDINRQNVLQNIQLSQQLYTKYYTQVESYKLQNQNKQPVFRKLDIPILPLSFSKNNPAQQAIIGSLLGFAIGLFFTLLVYFTIVGRKVYVKAKNQDED